jgi:predicted nuclease of restriction endonuclease-like RecB superfamily
MLTADLVKPRLQARGDRLHIDLLNPAEGHWQRTAADLIRLFQRHIGKTWNQWETALTHYEGDRLDYIVIRGLAKVLTDAATFTSIDLPVAAEELRRSLFAQGPVFEDGGLFQPQTRQQTLEQVAKSYDIPAELVEGLLFADRLAAHVLHDCGPEWTPETLIQRYNLELARAALYWSDQLEVEIHDTFKDFWRYLKLFKLMFEAEPIEGGYRVRLEGPISPFVQATTRYGRQFALFLPALFLCQRWQMQASVKVPQFGGRLTYRLDDRVPLVTHFRRSPEYDSRMEADFAAEFYARFGDERGKWALTREDEVILLGDTVMIPDFALTHRDSGQRVLIEIVGFWHPDYLRRKLAKVRAAKLDHLLLLVYEGVNLGAEMLADVPAEVLYFKNKPVLKDVMAAVERMEKAR